MMGDRPKRHLAFIAIATFSICAPVTWIVLRPDRLDDIDADAGELTEVTYRRPDDVPRVDLEDSTLRWNLSSLAQASTAAASFDRTSPDRYDAASTICSLAGSS